MTVIDLIDSSGYTFGAGYLIIKYSKSTFLLDFYFSQGIYSRRLKYFIEARFKIEACNNVYGFNKKETYYDINFERII